LSLRLLYRWRDGMGARTHRRNYATFRWLRGWIRRRLVLPTSLVRVLVVDDFEPWRRQICSLLQTRPELRVIAEAGDGLEAVQKATELQPDLILLDIGLPKLNGIEASHQISRLVPSAKILFVSQNYDLDVATAASSNGAKGFVRKENVRKDLLPAVEAVLLGGRFVSRGLHAEALPQAKI
jgi:DNA-binding NarL/FixJ family response regulator